MRQVARITTYLILVLCAATLCSQTLGPEIQINRTTAYNQFGPEISWDGTDRFIVVWNDAGQKIRGIRGYTEAWPVILENELTIHEATTPNLSTASVAFNQRTREALVHWEDEEGQVRPVPSTGEPGASLVVHPFNGMGFDSRVQPDADDGFVITFRQDYPGTGWRFFGKRVDTDGPTVGPRFMVAWADYGGQKGNGLAVNQSDRYLAVWDIATSPGGNSATLDIYPGQLDSDWDEEINLRSYGENPIGWFDEPEVAAIGPDGDFVVAWMNREAFATNLRGQRVAADGSLLGDEFIIEEENIGMSNQLRVGPQIAPDPEGGFAIAWSGRNSDADGRAIHARLYASNGQPITSSFQVNGYVTGDQTSPDITSIGDGRFLVVWQSLGSPGDDDSSTSIIGRTIVSPLLFLDDFESGTAGAWSAVVP